MREQSIATIERLEERTLLAGNVTAAIQNQILTITGDRRSNGIVIDTKGLGAGSVRLSSDDTSINGDFLPLEFTVIEIRISLGDGKDRVPLDNMQWAGRLEINTGNSGDYIQIDGSELNEVLVRSGDGNDTLNLVNSSVHETDIATAAGDDLVTLMGGSFARRVLINTGGGNDTIFHRSTFARGRRIDDGPGNDLITSESIQHVFDFRNGRQFWRGAFADVFRNPDVSQELEWGMRRLPGSVGEGQGLFIKSINSTDDTFMYVTRPVSGLEPGTYQVRFDIRFASNAPSNCSGIGGAPGESVFLRAGATPIRPRARVDEEGIMRLNVDHGQQGSRGKAASLAGNIANGRDCDGTLRYVSLRRRHIHTALVRTNAEGMMHLIVGTDSGFEGTTALYYQRIGVQLIRVAQ